MKTKKSRKFITILDLYIIKKLIATFVVAIALIIAVVIMFDLAQKLDDFIQNKVPLSKIIFDYYLNYIPNFANMFGYLFFFIAVIFVTSRLAARTEIIAILSGGISFLRLLRPFIFTALLVAIFNLFLTNFVLPHVNKNRLEFERVYYRNPYKNNLYNIHIQLSKGKYVYVQRFDNVRNTGYRFTEEIFSDNTDSIRSKLSADLLIYDSVRKQWLVENWIYRTINGKYETMTRGYRKSINLSMKPNDFNIGTIKPETLTNKALNAKIDEERMRGSKLVRILEVEKYQRLINPLAYLVLTFIGVSLSCRKTRGGTGLHLAAGIGMAFAFIIIMKATTVMATQSTLHPALSIGFPIILFFIASLFLIKQAPK
ncbi:MAG: LptF/LptG family permease [Bacteroidales bacterium]|jgi:lipopolysaccharide export system permease protein|nr:LptF/LptG family permease [Bacteroidales bacterium]